MSSSPQIGQLYRPVRPGYPVPQQPGGPGTVVVDPTQPCTIYPNGQNPSAYTPQTNPTPYAERAAMFFPACGHAIRSWEAVVDEYNGAPAAFILCPLCSYIVDILQPPSLAFDVNINPLILG
jgi:hypothetical protein